MKRIIVYIFLTGILSLALFYPYSMKIADSLPNAVDPVFYAWNISHNTDAILQNGKNLLNTNIFYPESNTLAFSDTLYAQTLFTAPIIFLTKNPVFAENLYIFLTFLMAALAMFYLVYFITSHIWASALSGLFYSFCYPRIAQIGHMPMISSQWLPLCILFFIQFLSTQKIKYAHLTILFFLLSLASSIYFAVFLIPTLGIICLIYFIIWIKNRNLKPFVHITRLSLLLIIPALLVTFIVSFPYIRMKTEIPQIKRSLEDSAKLGAALRDYRTILPTSLMSHIGFRTDINERPLYPTVALLGTAILGIIFGWKKYKKFTLIFFLISISSLILSFGPYLDIIVGKYQWFHVSMPYGIMYQYFPLLQAIRVPARFSIMVMLSLSVLSGIFLSLLPNKKTTYGIYGALGMLFLFEIWQINTPSVHIPTKNELPKVYEWLIQEPNSSIIVELPLRPLWRGISMEDQIMKTYEQTRDNDVFAIETYRVYFSVFHKKRMINGYSGFFPQVYHDHASLLDNFPTKESVTMLQQTQIRYIIIHAWQYTDWNFTDIQRRLLEFPSIQFVKQFDNDYVYEIIK